MKIQDLGRRLDALSVLLGHAQPEMLERLAGVAELLKTSSATNLKQFTKALGTLTLASNQERTGITGGDLVVALSTLQAIAKQLEAKKAIVDDIAALRDALSAAHLQQADTASITAGLQAPRKATRTAPTTRASAIRDDVVSEYLSNLEATLGEAAFEQHYDRLTCDRRVRGAEAAAIASKFVSETPKNAKKSDSLDRIKARHDNFIASRLKDRVLTISNGGR